MKNDGHVDNPEENVLNETGKTPTERSQAIETQTNASSHTDDVTSRMIGDFGSWQLRISVMMSLLKLPMAWYQLSVVFLAPQHEFWCEKPPFFAHYTDTEWREICKPRTEEHPCLIYDPELLIAIPSLDKRFVPLVPCSKYIFDNSTFRSTIISEWDLVCSRRWLVELSQVILMWGVLVGNVLFGVLADKLGRKKPLMAAILMQSAASFVSALSPWYWLFLVNRFILALASGGIGILSFVMCMEIVSGKYRTIIPISYHIPFGVGSTIMAVLAYYLRDWRKFEFSLACLSSAFLAYYWLIPESPRWLLARGQKNEALEILRKAAAVNHREIITEDDIALPSAVTVRTPGFLAFMRYKNLRLKTLLLSGNWFFTGMSFFAFSQYLGQIGANIFLTVALGGLFSTPGSVLCIFIVKLQGRKIAVGGAQLFTALCFLMILAVPKDVFRNDWPRIFIAGLGLAGMAVSVPALYLFTGELYPTLGRNVGLGGCSMFARIGSMMAPVLVSLEHLSPRLPLVLLAVCSAVQAAMVLPLPETIGCPLPDTIEQAERFDKQYSRNYRREKKRNILRQAARKEYTTE